MHQRRNLQKGVVVIPGSSNPDHIKENTELYDFALTDAEMAQMMVKRKTKQAASQRTIFFPLRCIRFQTLPRVGQAVGQGK